MNDRDHRKLSVIYDEIEYVGGVNILDDGVNASN